MIHVRVAEISTWLVAVVIILVCVLLVCAYVLSIIWTQRRHKPLSHVYTGLYDNARRLGLQVCDVKDKCMYAAVVDQLVVKCPNVKYSTDRLKTMVQASLPTSEDKSGRVLPMLRQRFGRSKVQNELQKDVDKLQVLADRLHRVIELVHDDRRDETFIRPFDLQHDEVITVLYIGRCRQGFYYSLRPRSASVTNRRRERVENGETVNDLPTNEDRVNVENNVMVGDNNRQYIINRPNFNEDGTVVQHCHVIGNGSTQNILVTMTDSADLSRFLQNDTLSEGRIKIRQSSYNMSTEQIEQGEEAVIQALNDTGGDSYARHELDRILDRFDLTFDRAVRGCMVLQFKAQSRGSFIRFANKFENHDLDILVKYLLKYLLIDKDAKNVTIDLELSIHSDHEVECQKNRSGTVKTMENDKDTDHAYSTGITVYCKPKSPVNDREKFNGEKAHELANDVSTLVTDVVRKSAAQNHLHTLNTLHGEFQACAFNPRDVCQEEMDQEKIKKLSFLYKTIGDVIDYSIQEITLEDIYLSYFKSLCLLLRRQEMHHELLKKSWFEMLGIIKGRNGIQGTCFQVGKNYILTAAHVVGDCKEEGDLTVQFGNEDWEQATLVYFCEYLDFALILVYGRTIHGMFHLYPICCGSTVDMLYPGDDLRFRSSIERAVIVSTDFKAPNQKQNYMLLESISELGLGSSGSPIVINKDGKLYLVAMLIGLLKTNKHPCYVAINFMDILKHLQKNKPELVKKLTMISTRGMPHYYTFYNG